MPINIREAESLFRSLFQNTQAGIVISDREGVWIDANPAICELLGLRREDLIGRAWPERVPAEYDERRAQARAELNQTGHWRGELPLLRADGRQVALDWQVTELSESSLRLAIATDVTERKRGEAELREMNESLLASSAWQHELTMRAEHAEQAAMASERSTREARDYAQTILRVSPVPLLVLDSDLRVLTVNEAFYRKFKVTPAATEGHLVYELDNGHWNTPELCERLEDILAHDSSFEHFEVTHDFPNIGRRTMLLNARSMTVEGGPKRIVLVLEDITERKQSEEALRDTDRRKDEFLAILAHELRNPLAPIRTGLELMKVAGDDLAVMEEVRATMERQVRQLVRLIDDLMDVSRITRGKLNLQRRRLALAEVVQGAVEATRPFIDAVGHNLSVTLPAQPLSIDGDPHRLTQVLSNLLNNAAKYSPQPGAIRLSARQDGNEAVISVTDEGLGIAPEKLSEIFEMFSQIDRSPHGDNVGLGIGLTLVKSLVEMHGGTVEVRSDGANLGSEFMLRLPAATDRVTAPAEPPTPGSPGFAMSKHRVLVVDDNEDAARTLSLACRVLGNDVRVVHDGMEAVAAAAEFRPELVLMDIGMPRMNGYEAARHIRAHAWGAEMLLVAVTGWGQDEDRRRTGEAGFDRHLVKPVESAALQAVFAELSKKA